METICDNCKYSNKNNAEEFGCRTYRKHAGVIDTFCVDHEYFKPIKTKAKTMDYELTEKYKTGISLSEICEQIHTTCESLAFIKLYKEVLNVEYYTNNIKMCLVTWLQFESIQENVSWLINKGFLQKKEEKLKRCFRCRSDNTAVTVFDDLFVVMCNDCNIMTKKCFTAEGAIKNWNTKY